MRRWLIAFFGWGLLNGSAYGDYPPPKAILGHLLGRDWDAGRHFKNTFNGVRKYAKSACYIGQSDPRILIGEEDDCLEWPKDQRRWRWYSQMNSPFKVLIDGSYVFFGKVIDKLVREPAFRKRFCPSGTDTETWLSFEGEAESVREKRFVSVREMLKTLTSKIFMERLLGEDTVEAFLRKRSAFLTLVRISLSPDPLQPFHRVGVFLEYVHVEEFTKTPKKEGESPWLLRVGFHLVWNAETDRFADDEVYLSSFRTGNLHLCPKAEARGLLKNRDLKEAYGVRGLSLQRKKITTEKHPKARRVEKSVPSRKLKKHDKVFPL